MGKTVLGLLSALILVAVIVGIDLLFFKDQPWERLAANVGFALLFGAFYFRFIASS